ncbi:hypothetical protein LTR95_007882 [Oleoguttula sp. CCFEE 5521]
MGPQDEELAQGAATNQPIRPYHDDSDESDSFGPDAPLNSSRPSTELDYNKARQPTWREDIAARIPPSIRRGWKATAIWAEGPKPPRIFSITPFLPKIQHAPIALLDRYAPRKIHRFGLLLLFYFAWLMTFSLILYRSSLSADIPAYGTPVRLTCTSRYWSDANGCGIDGNRCRPFSNATLAFRCPADCHKILLLNPHAVGDQEVVYKPLVIGGPLDYNVSLSSKLHDNAVYRSDSFICASAVHAGFLRDITGGCGVLSLTGEVLSLPGDYIRNGIPATSFASYFPHTFGFLKNTTTQCRDLRWPALIVSVIFTSLFALFTTSPPVFFYSTSTILYLTTALATDPPAQTDFPSLISIAAGRFLPAAFCMAITYLFTARRTLTNLTAQIEKTVLWLGPAWVGALNNYTFDRIPIQRLTPHDLHAQPGAIPALIIVVLTIFGIALGQAWSFRLEGRMPKYLLIYGIFVGSLMIMLALPWLSLRIHHYILALLLLPGTAFQNRPSLIYQGLLVGLFVNGVARWGFDSILQTQYDLSRGQQQGFTLPVVDVLATGATNITFGFGGLPIWDRREKQYDGISILVNDVERFRGYGDEWTGGVMDGGNLSWTWERHHLKGILSRAFPEYFRFAYMSGSDTGDYSKAGVWGNDGSWTEPKAGASNVDTEEVVVRSVGGIYDVI